MTIAAYVFVVVGAIFWSISNVFSKKALAGWKNREALFNAIFSGSCSLMLFLWSFATGGPKIQYGFSLLQSFWFAAIVTGILNIGILYFITLAKSLEDVSLVMPISASTPAVVIFSSILILGEYPSALGWVGIWLLVVGTYLLNIQQYLYEARQKGNQVTLRDWLAPFLMLTKSWGVRFAFFAAMLGAISLNYDGLVARRSNIAFGLGVVWAIAAVGSFVIALLRREHKNAPLSWGFFWKVLCVIALLQAISSWVGAHAYREAIVPYVGTLKRLNIPMTIILAYFLIGERTNFQNRLIGGTIMAIGAVLVGIS